MLPYTVFYTGVNGWAWFDGRGFSDGFANKQAALKNMLICKYLVARR